MKGQVLGAIKCSVLVGGRSQHHSWTVKQTGFLGNYDVKCAHTPHPPLKLPAGTHINTASLYGDFTLLHKSGTFHYHWDTFISSVPDGP